MRFVVASARRFDEWLPMNGFRSSIVRRFSSSLPLVALMTGFRLSLDVSFRLWLATADATVVAVGSDRWWAIATVVR
jgi:hypothetical protein